MLAFSKNDQILTKELATKIELILSSHDNNPKKLVGILLDVQEIIVNHYIPADVAYYIAEKLRVKPTAVYDVISFYSSLSDRPRAKYPIQVCGSVVCKINQNDIVFETLKELLGIDLNEVTYDGKFTLERVSCFGACDKAPAVRVNGKVYGNLTTREKIENLLNELS